MKSGALSRFSRFFGQGAPYKVATTPQELAEVLRRAGFTVDSGAVVNPETAIRTAAVYACVRVLSDSIGMLPLRVFKTKAGSQTIAEDHPVDFVLSRRPNEWQTPFEFKRMLTGHVALRGNAYAKISRLGDRLEALYPLNPDAVEPVQTSDLSVEYHYTRRNGAKEVFKQSEIFHLRALSSCGVKGMSPIQAAAQAIGLAQQAEKFGAKLFANGARPSGTLRHPGKISAEAQKRLKESFDEVNSGAENAMKTLLLEEGMTWEAMTITPDEAQFIESRKLQRNEIAMFYGVPPHMIGDIERGTSWGSGIEQQGLGFVTYTLLPWLTNWGQAVARDLLNEKERRNMHAEFKTEVLTQADFLTRQNGRNVMLNAGVISPNEWRQAEGMNPREGGDEFKSVGSSSDSSPPDPTTSQEQQPQDPATAGQVEVPYAA